MIIFSGKVLFRNNISHRGGAAHLFKSRIGLERDASGLFKDNHAKDVGGAIYVYSARWLSNYYEIDVESGNYFYVLINCNSYDKHNFNTYFQLNIC